MITNSSLINSIKADFIYHGGGRSDFAVGRLERKTGDTRSVLLSEHLD